MTTRPATESGFQTLPMLPAVVLLEVGKRLGLAKPMIRLALGMMFSRRMKERAFRGYVPDARDVFVTTFAKSGTNWMMQIAQQITHRGKAEFAHIHDVVPWPDAPGRGLAPLEDRGEADRSPTGLRVIKTHLETEFVPYDPRAKYLTVLRDPKEVVVSSYYFLGGLFGVLDHLSIDDWFDVCMRPGLLASTWAAHTASFWDWRERPNVLVLSYREILEEPVLAIERVSRVMGVALSPSELQEVGRRSHFPYMQAHEAQFAPPRLPFTREERRPKMIRRGAAGGSDELLDEARRAEIDRRCRAELERRGSRFPYDATFG